MKARIHSELLVNMEEVTAVKIIKTDDLKRPNALVFCKKNGQNDVVMEWSYEKMVFVIDYLTDWWLSNDATNIDFVKIMDGKEWGTRKSVILEN